MFRAKRIFAAFLTLIMISSLAAGCSNKSADSSASQGKKDSVKELSVAFTMHQNDESLLNTYNEIAAKYKEKTGITIKYEFIPENDVRTWVTTQHSAGTSPDVYDSKVADVWSDYEKGYILDLGPYLEKESHYIPGKPWKDTFSQVLYKQAANPQGVVTGVPLSISGIRLIYNKSILQKAGITETPKTLDEFNAACAKIKKAGFVPLGFPNATASDASVNWWGHNFIAQLDQSLREKMDYSKDGMVQVNELVKATDEGLIDFTKYPFKDTIKILNDMSPYFNSDSSSTKRPDVFDMWLRGNVAIMAIGSHDSALVKGLKSLNFEYSMSYFPVVSKSMYPESNEKPINNGGRLTNTIAVSKTGNADREAAAVDFLQYFMSVESQTMLLKNNFIIPPITGIELNDDLKWWLTSDKEDIVRANYFGGATSKQFADFCQMTTQLMFSGNMNVDKCCTEMNAEWKTCMEQLKQNNDWSKENNYGIK